MKVTVQEIELLLSTDVEEIIKNPSMSSTLMKCYSVLYLQGGTPRFCAVSQRKYYKQLQINGIIMAKEEEKKDNRTHVLSWNGVKMTAPVWKDGKLIVAHEHINSELLTDEKAIAYLKNGALKSKDFKTLPKGYVKK